MDFSLATLEGKEQTVREDLQTTERLLYLANTSFSH